ncbi:hypothetical protein A374_04539 [Fictibacillus macauensis ZFHKF-1]|uniref:YCII-related domain-containing protein n=1 Tax=Fictibacillus macauensis ZFHKF-1 TaxID=1196324 RepID=I8ALL6_9BACL|nr:YciI family protein [Fictibacillus macauensis]EIT86812.1 hypothetical protein A374_04539 [Fictibacillus macauensis ZFHKF-1]
MKYFAVTLPILDEKKSVRYRDEHLAYLQEATSAGHIVTYGRFADGSGGLVIYKAASLAAAEELATNDPYVTTGARDCVIKEWVMNTDVLTS